MKVNVIKVAMLMALGLMSNQLLGQVAVGVGNYVANRIETVREATISADTDATGREPIRFYTRNNPVAYFHDTGIGFQTSAHFEQAVTFRNTTNFGGVTNFKANVNARRIGIGVTPEEAIHVRYQNIRVDGGQYQSYGTIHLHPDVDGLGGDDIISFKNSNNEEMAKIQDGVFTLKDNSRLESSGQLNIQGSSFSFKRTNGSEQARLENGILQLNQIRLNVTTFPDYVFVNNYKLMPLEEVDAYIKKYKHLPNMPSEAEVVKEGMNVGQINTLLVEKVEELTLYTIEQEKKLKNQEGQIQELLKRMAALENKN